MFTKIEEIRRDSMTLVLEVDLDSNGNPSAISGRVVQNKTGQVIALPGIDKIEEMAHAMLAAIAIAKEAAAQGAMSVEAINRETGEHLTVDIPAGANMQETVDKAFKEHTEKNEKKDTKKVYN